MDPGSKQWPIQLALVPANAPYLKNADLLIAADCVAFSYADFHHKLFKGKVLLVAYPKLDDLQLYKQKLTAIIRDNDLRSITYAHMEVPCCSGLVHFIKEALVDPAKALTLQEAEIFSDEVKVICPHCKEYICRTRLPSCVDWCKHALECIGKDKWGQLKSG